MMFFKLVIYDIKSGFLREYRKIVLIPILFALFCFTFYLKHMQFQESITIGTMGDYLLYIFGGMKEYIPSKTEPFNFPIIWMWALAYLSYITLYYPYDDLMGYGQNVLVRSGGRIKWWYSKCVWNIISVTMFFLIGWGTVFLFCVFSGMPITMEISRQMFECIFGIEENVLIYPNTITIALLLMPLLTMIALGLLQMLLSLIIKPIYSFLTTITLLLSSAYYVKPYMICGNSRL